MKSKKLKKLIKPSRLQDFKISRFQDFNIPIITSSYKFEKMKNTKVNA